MDRPAVGTEQAGADAHEGGLAGAVLPRQADDLAGLHRQVDVVEDDRGPEPLADPRRLELGGHALYQGSCEGATVAIRVIQWTTGNVGRRSVRAIVRHPHLELVGVYAHGAEKSAAMPVS